MKRSILLVAAMLVVGTLATPASASGTGWSITPSPNPRVPTGQLFWESCTGATSCTAVGTYVKASGVGVTLAEHWNGSTWRIQPTPSPRGAAVSSLLGVSCTPPSACTAVGNSVNRAGSSQPLAERWNGTRWRIQPTPSPAQGGGFLNGVSCTSPSACTAAGFSIGRSGIPQTLAERWDGSRWRIQPTPSLAGGPNLLSGVACPSPSACTAAGFSIDRSGIPQTLAERWDGTRWRIQPTPGPAQGGGSLTSVACTSVSSCTTVGVSNAGTLAERWDGTRWRIQPTPHPAGAQFTVLNTVACPSPSACTAAGFSIGRSGIPQTLAERWDGSRWRIQPTPSRAGGPNLLFGVACPSSSACTAAGFSAGRSGIPQTLAERWNGSRWRIHPTPNPAGAAPSHFGSVSCTSPSACTATGGAANLPLAERWDGATWRIQHTPNLRSGGFLASVSCTSAVACTAVGARTDTSENPIGTLAEHWDGRKWSIQPVPSLAGTAGTALYGVSCTARTFCMGVGESFDSSHMPIGPVAERWNGTRWRIQRVPAASGSPVSFLGGVVCQSSSFCIAVGARSDKAGNPTGALAERWNGTRWRIQRTPNPAAGAGLSAVSCTSSSACTAVGGSEAGTLAERWDGTAWRIQPTPKLPGAENFFNGVACKGHACTAVGLHLTDSGPFTLAERWDGTAWRIQPTPKIPGAYDIDPPAVACPIFSSCMAAGSYTNDGPKVTLTEQWNSTGNSAQPTTSRPAPPGSPPAACVRTLLLEPPPAGERTPVSPWHWSQPKTFSTPTSATWPTRLPWGRTG
jgi:hypothetical protein